MNGTKAQNGLSKWKWWSEREERVYELLDDALQEPQKFEKQTMRNALYVLWNYLLLTMKTDTLLKNALNVMMSCGLFEIDRKQTICSNYNKLHTFRL